MSTTQKPPPPRDDLARRQPDARSRQAAIIPFVMVLTVIAMLVLASVGSQLPN